jgi:prepilin-type N-terminal cleavage/methylation domain-containing protein
MNTSRSVRRAARGFSMVELLVTVVLAGIIFAAMVPVFAGALKATSRDNLRVTATNIAQDRIEKIRMLDYADITTANLNDPTFARDPLSGENVFGTSFTPTGSSRSFTIGNYFVVNDPKYKTIQVTVSWSASASDSTTMQTVIMNPSAVTTGSSPTPSATPSPGSTTGTDYTLTVSVTNNTVTSAGVTVVRTDGGRHDVMTPSPQIPNMTNGLTRSWTGLVGGPSVVYRLTVNFKVSVYSAESKYTDVSLIDDTPVYFDTDPYH